MKLFGVTPEDQFKEYRRTDFQTDHTELILEEWLETNPDHIIDDGRLLIIGRQVRTNLSSIIDLLGLDRHGNVVVVELKRGKTPRDVLAQSLEYASFAATMDYDQLENVFRTYMEDEFVNLAQGHRECFELPNEEGVSFNKDQSIVIVGQSITPEIIQTSEYLGKKGIRVACIEFTFFETDDGLQLLSSDTVVATEPVTPPQIASAPRSKHKTTEPEFMEALNDYGKPVMTRFLSFAREHQFPIIWGDKGFSLNVNLDGIRVPFCFGYPPNSVYKQSLYTPLFGRGGILSKVDISSDAFQTLYTEALATNLFQTAERELKCRIDRSFLESDIDWLISWFQRITELIIQHGLKNES